jgi:hypothetical protein
LKQGVKFSVRVLQGTKAKRKDSHSKTGSYDQRCMPVSSESRTSLIVPKEWGHSNLVLYLFPRNIARVFKSNVQLGLVDFRSDQS